LISEFFARNSHALTAAFRAKVFEPTSHHGDH